MATRKITVEVEVPGWLATSDAEEVIRSAVRRAVLYLTLERVQRREPTSEELEELAGEAKKSIYKKVVEEQ
ncbi:MAG: hypothetical protein GSR85_04390 [Desulfurococcales archaeon]|nr:hypothetical protein [Desulfurococcales archaeon]